MSDTVGSKPSVGRRIELAALTVFGVSAALIMFVNSLGRYIFGGTFVWAEEIIRLLFVWSTFISITTGFIRNEHIGFDGLAKKNAVLGIIFRAVYAVSLIAVGGIVAYYGFIYCTMTGDVPLASTNLPTSLFMWPGVASGAAWLILGVYRLVRLCAGKPERSAK
jgi:TRAP-type C4-dicarboxylate transport system permease small subunit